MGYKAVITNKYLMEEIEYQDKAFPIFLCEDYFDEYLNGEVEYHWHNDFEFGIVLKGEVKYFIHQGAADQECEILKVGDGVFVNSKSLHRMVQTEPGSILFNFVLPSDFFVFLPLGEVHQKSVLPVIQSPAAGLFLKKEEEEHQPLLECIAKMHGLSRENPGYELQCIELICRLWRKLLKLIASMKELPSISRAERLQEQRLRTMLSYIHAHYSENLSIDSLIQAANISRSECFRCFRAVIGKTPSEYLCQYRLSQAAYFLTYTDRTLSDICYSCGFKNMSYFGKLFRESWGMSPGQYRKTGGRAEEPNISQESMRAPGE